MLKQAITLNLSELEVTMLDRLVAQKKETKTAILRSALKLYYFVHARCNSTAPTSSQEEAPV